MADNWWENDSAAPQEQSPSPDFWVSDEKAPGQGIVAQVLRKAEIAGGGVLKGLGATMGLPGTLSDLAYAHGIEPESLHNALGFLPTSQSLVNDLGPLAGPEPESETEKYLSGAAQGIGGAIPALALGPLSIPAVAGLAGSGAGSGLAATAAHEMFPNSTVAPVAAGIVGGLAGEGPASLLTTGIAKTVMRTADKDAGLKGAAVAQAQSDFDNLQSLHNDLVNAHNSTKLDQADALAQARAQANASIVQANQQAETASASAAAKLGGPKTLQEAGKVVQQQATDWMKALPGKVQGLLDPVYAKVPAGTEVTPTALRSTLEDINSTAGSLENLNSDLKPYLPAKWLSKLNALQEGQKTGLIGPITVDDARALRTAVGEAMSNPKLLNDIGNANVERIYGALSQDIRGALPQDLQADWDSANAQTHQLYDYARNTIGKIIKSPEGDGNATPEAIASGLVTQAKKGGTTIQALRSQLPDAADALGAHIVSSPSGDWLKVSPEAKEALVPDQQSRQLLDQAHQAAAQAPDQAKSQVDSLRLLHDAENRQAAREIEEARVKLQAQQGVLSAAKSAKGEADAYLKSLGAAGETADWRGLKRAAESLAGGVGGHILGSLAMHTLGVAGPQAGSLLLGGLPYGISAVKGIASNPRILLGPAVGAAAGNSLALSPQTSP